MILRGEKKWQFWQEIWSSKKSLTFVFQVTTVVTGSVSPNFSLLVPLKLGHTHFISIVSVTVITLICQYDGIENWK